MVDRFRTAAQAAGRDPTKLKIMLRANVPITGQPLTSNRSFLGGSPEQIFEDLHRLQDFNVDHVLFINKAQPLLDD
jgi:hypothetical protein